VIQAYGHWLRACLEGDAVVMRTLGGHPGGCGEDVPEGVQELVEEGLSRCRGAQSWRSRGRHARPGDGAPLVLERHQALA
jgi:hypothetical protein